MAETMLAATSDLRIREAKAEASARIAEHVQLAAELAAIQDELERRVSLATPRKGQPWNSHKPQP